MTYRTSVDFDIKDFAGKILLKAGADLSRADLSDANLYGADLYDANLSRADLSRADLRGANLSRANLYDANLRGAYLRGADLRGADLRGANLSGADLYDANLSGADLSGADLYDANLSRADLRGANLRGANLRGADLRGADLRGANLRGAKDIPPLAAAQLLVCPEKGAYTAWKKCGKAIVELLIPADAQRSSATSRKCRASHAEVIAIHGTDANTVYSSHNRDFPYKVGTIVRCHEWDTDRWNECSGGIHHFITRAEAEAY